MSQEAAAVPRRTPVHLWIVGVLAVLWNAVGAFDYLMTQTRNESYMAQFTPEQLAYFYEFPTWVVAFWALAVWGGVAGAVLLLLRKRMAVPVLLVSLACMVVTSIHNFLLSDGLAVMGNGAVAFSGVIFVIALGLWLYARAMAKGGVLGSAAAILLFLLLPLAASAQEPPPAGGGRSIAEVMRDVGDAEWRGLDPENTIYMQVPGGRVVIELAPDFAPRHVANIRALARAGWFDGGGVIRSQDNYVAQWATRSPAEGDEAPSMLTAPLAAEFEVSAGDLRFTPLPDRDVYAEEVGFVDGFPVGRDPAAGTAWLTHCYGVVGVARDNDPNSGNGTQLYAVTGHAPRHLDRNLTMVGRVVAGMEHLSTLPRGTGSLGFYESEGEVAKISSVAVGSDLPPEQRAQLELLRTDSPSFRAYVLARRSRVEAFFLRPAHRIDVCNVGVPTRPIGG